MRSFVSLLMSVAVFTGPIVSTATSEVKRVLLISAPDLNHPSYREQAATLLPEWGGLIERDFEIQTRFGAESFSVILIGKDGGEKLRRHTPLSTAELFAVVDAMPMRRAEMRSRQSEKR